MNVENQGSKEKGTSTPRVIDIELFALDLGQLYSLSEARSRVQRARKMLRDAILKCCRVELDSRGRAVDYEVDEGCDGCSMASK